MLPRPPHEQKCYLAIGITIEIAIGIAGNLQDWKHPRSHRNCRRDSLQYRVTERRNTPRAIGIAIGIVIGIAGN